MIKMWKGIALTVILGITTLGFGQQYSFKKKFGTQKNAMYFYWGYNRSIYSKSDVRFYSPDYDFTAVNLAASDRPSTKFSEYINPSTLTVPQFNVRLGWYYKFRWDVSIGYDHMKYVMDRNQNLYLSGNAGETTTSQLNGMYDESNGMVPIRYDDLHYENTNGLNYISFQLNNTAPIYKTRDLRFAVMRRAGFGFGPVVTQTDFNWDGQEYHSGQKLKLGGYGLSVHGGLRFDFFKHFFLQSNWSTGFIHLPKNATIIELDHFSEHKFVYADWQLLGGFILYIRTKNDCDSCPDWH